jgi:hypothetical protein
LFPSVELDENNLYRIAEESFSLYARNLYNEELASFEALFHQYQLHELQSVLTQIQYTKYNHKQELIHFDQSTNLHFLIKLHIYALDSDGESETLAGYTLVLNSNLEIVDDFLV